MVRASRYSISVATEFGDTSRWPRRARWRIDTVMALL
jgi:hypothetical protein